MYNKIGYLGTIWDFTRKPVTKNPHIQETAREMHFKAWFSLHFQYLNCCFLGFRGGKVPRLGYVFDICYALPPLPLMCTQERQPVEQNKKQIQILRKILHQMAFITQFWPEMPNTTIILPGDEKRVFRLWELVDLSLCRKSTQCLEMNRNFKKRSFLVQV